MDYELRNQVPMVPQANEINQVEYAQVPFYKRKIFIILLIISIIIIVIVGVVLWLTLTKEERCLYNDETNCSSCDDEHISQCGKCREEYYMPSDDSEKKICKKCTIENCIKCSGTKNSCICNECKYRYHVIYKNGNIDSCNKCDLGEGNKCFSCGEHFDSCSECNLYYNEYYGSCVTFYIIAKYEISQDNETIFLIYNEPKNISIHINIDGKDEKLEKNEFTFDKKGNHTVIFTPNVGSLDGLFQNNKKIISASFISDYHYKTLNNIFSGASSLQFANFSHFYTEDLSSVQYMFRDCYSLKSIILPKFEGYLTRLDGLFQNCYSLTSIDFSNMNIYSYPGIYMNSTFENCSSLTYINFESSRIDRLAYIGSMFKGCSSLTSIDISNLGINTITYQYFRINELFYDCYNLSFINIYPLTGINLGGNIIIFNHLPRNGKIIIEEDLFGLVKKTIPQGWEKTIKKKVE